MQQLYAFSQLQLIAFAAVLLRISAFVVVWPIFSVFNVPQQVKVLLALSITFILFPLVGFMQIAGDLGGTQLIWIVMREVAVGLTLGFVTRAFFYAVGAAGELAGISMGLANASLFNPAMSSQGSAVEQLQVVLATLLFLGFNGHHVFLQALAHSFEVVPLSTGSLKFLNANYWAGLLQMISLSALKLSAPIIGAILILNLAMGLVGRAVPQINVLVMSLPVTIFGGLAVMFICLPLFQLELVSLFEQMSAEIFTSLKGF